MTISHKTFQYTVSSYGTLSKARKMILCLIHVSTNLILKYTLFTVVYK